MKTPMLLLGAGLIFWGWQTGMWLFAIPMAILIEGSHFISWRWDFSKADVRRVGNLCLIVLIFISIFLLIQNPTFYFVYTLLQWLPVVSFPLLATQTYSLEDKIDITTLFLLFNEEETNKNKRFTININYLYLAICILAASNANVRDIYFYIGMFVLLAIALWSVRSQRFSPMLWLCFILTAGSIGFIGQLGLHQLHLTIEDRVATWYSNGNELETNSLKKQTNIGDIGVLKRSNEIAFRVATENQQTRPRLLREATYNKYKASMWVAAKPNFTSVQPEKDGTSWRIKDLTPQPPSLQGKGENSKPLSLQERGSSSSKPFSSQQKQENSKPLSFQERGLERGSKITISTTLRGGQGLLTLPDGTFEIDELPVSRMEKNKYGAVKVAGKVNNITYDIHFNHNLSLDNAPTEDDLQIPDREKPALNQILRQLDIPGKSPPEIVKRVDMFFHKNFAYSLQLTGKENNATPISTFLLKTRAGHCEYFATATTLLLRAAGIPARYAVGYSVREFSNLENQYIVRSRHAHAWTMVYLNKRWQVLDTTPADWTSIEDANASKFGFISDLWSLLTFKLGNIIGSQALQYGWWLILPLIFILMWRFGNKKGVRRLSVKRILPKAKAKSDLTGKNSEFAVIEKALNELGLTRHPSESLKSWIKRMKEESAASDLIDDIIPIVELHYRDRFDPAGIKETEKTILKSSIRSWLDKYDRASKEHHVR